jgi:precorrin-6B methylase 2
MKHTIAAAFFACAASAWAQTPDAPQVGQVSKDSVWVPTPERLIHRMLQLADTTPNDVVLDLGSGDGRIPIHAAKHFGARAIGVELEENLVRIARQNAAAHGVAKRAQFVQGDLFESDLSKATVIALYISPGAMEKLKPRLLVLPPGTRIVSHQFTMHDWEPDEMVRAEGREAYLWVVPAMLAGEWRVRLEAEDFRLRVEQRYQLLATQGERAGKPVPVIGARLRGTELRFTSFDSDGNTRQYTGRVHGGRLEGKSQGQGIAPRPWTAVRVPRAENDASTPCLGAETA